jgi:hypothetical protein
LMRTGKKNVQLATPVARSYDFSSIAVSCEVCASGGLGTFVRTDKGGQDLTFVDDNVSRDDNGSW